jgi:signal transduction histidine kinase
MHMSIKDNLESIKQDCFQQITQQLAIREGVRIGFQVSLISFYDLLERALESNEPAWMENILDEWVTVPTETELEAYQNNLVRILSQILETTFEIARNKLSDQEAIDLMAALLPVFTHATLYVSRRETQIRIEHITKELNQARIVVERLEKSKSDFISVAAHELKTPLTLIDGYASMLNEALNVDEGRKKQVEICLKGVDAGTKRLREIVDDMIDVSLIDNNLLSLAFQPIWLYQIIGSIERELEATIRQRKIKYCVHKFKGINEMFFGDSERLYQAIRNVILNAIKYTPDGGNIDINGRLLPGFIELIVKDTGIGIDLEDHTRIFEKFGRLGDVSLHSSGKTKFKGGGPGLGLPIAKGIIDAHGGTIWVESDGFDEVNCPGSTFHIMLPLLKEPPDDKTAKLFRNFPK